MHLWKLILSILAILAVSASTTAAQPASEWTPRKGFSVGLALQAERIGTEDENDDGDFRIDEDGRGLSLTVGYAVSNCVALMLAIGGTKHDTTVPEEATLGTVTAEVHYRFMPGSRARPFLFGGLGGTSASISPEDLDVELTGGMATLGVGVLYLFTKHFQFDAALRLDLINWTEISVSQTLDNGNTVSVSDPVQEDGSAGKLLAGLTWVF